MNMFMRFEDAFTPGPYIKNLKCFSVAMMGDKQRQDVDKGGKIILPTSALEHLTRLHIEYPMLFKIVNKSKNRTTHCGVLEFIAEEGRCYLPFWMMRNLIVTEGEIIQVEYVKLPVAQFAKFQPQSVDFLEITNPKAVLENALRNFACLTKEDMISINYNDKDYELLVMETRPGNAVSIIECDMDVDFAAPVGYEEPKKKNTSNPIGFGNHKSSSASLAGSMMAKSLASSGPSSNSLLGSSPKVEGYRLDGKAPNAGRKRNELSTSSLSGLAGGEVKPGTSASLATNDLESSVASAQVEARGRPFYDFPIGLIRFHHNFDELDNQMDIDSDESKKSKQESKGQRLRDIGVKQ